MNFLLFLSPCSNLVSIECFVLFKVLSLLFMTLLVKRQMHYENPYSLCLKYLKKGTPESSSNWISFRYVCFCDASIECPCSFFDFKGGCVRICFAPLFVCCVAKALALLFFEGGRIVTKKREAQVLLFSS